MRGTMIARLPPACARRVKIVSLPAVKAFVDQEGYRMRKRMTIHDIIRFRKEGAVPIVMIGYENCLFSTNMRTGEHGAVYTVPERVAQLMEMPKFHLLVRRGPNTRWRFGTEEKPEEDVWYMGVYCAQNPHASLSEEGWRHLDDREQADVIRFQHHLHPDVPTDIISDYAAGYCKPSLMILENKDYDWQFVDRLVRVGAQVLQPAVPVNPRPRVDFRALRQQMLNASG
ncbi:hypothetical protein AcW1_005300 [Taiwanofungus camphoratus]|nr:hypothetical protein AcW1_005300 [Antrodia cinnamomea]